MITYEKDTKENRLLDLENRFKYNLIDVKLYKEIKKHLLDNKKIQYYLQNEIVIKYTFI